MDKTLREKIAQLRWEDDHKTILMACKPWNDLPDDVKTGYLDVADKMLAAVKEDKVDDN